MKLQDIIAEVDAFYGLLVDTHRYLHMYPELSEREFQTQKFIESFLDKEGIAHKKIASTGVMAWVEGMPGGNIVAVRGDIDALPITEESAKPYASAHMGVMHACGHDAHTAIVLGLAKFFRGNADKFCGTVKFFFQPAEETIGGAKRMIAEGCMEAPKVDYIVGLHVTPSADCGSIQLKRGALNASTNEVTLAVKGKISHGAYPHNGVDAIVAASYIVTALQTVVSRSVSPIEPAVVTFGQISGGTKGNIIADEVTLKGTIRASNEALRSTLIDRVRKIASSTAEALGAQCDVSIDEEGYPSLINNDEVVDIIAKNAIEYLGADNVHLKPDMSMGAEDFSFFVREAKGAFLNLGCRTPKKEAHALHTKSFDIDERCLKTGVVLQAMNILNLLSKGRKLL